MGKLKIYILHLMVNRIVHLTKARAKVTSFDITHPIFILFPEITDDVCKLPVPLDRSFQFELLTISPGNISLPPSKNEFVDVGILFYILTDFNYATLTSPYIFQTTVECKLPLLR